MKPSIAELTEQLKVREGNLKEFLKSPQGKESLKLIEDTFGGDVVVPNDPYLTHVRIGEKRVVEYLKTLMERE